MVILEVADDSQCLRMEKVSSYMSELGIGCWRRWIPPLTGDDPPSLWPPKVWGCDDGVDGRAGEARAVTIPKDVTNVEL